MAVNKHFRNEKRMPSFYVMATIGVFIALCLIGMWILSTPSGEEVSNKVETVHKTSDGNYKEITDTQQFEESTTEIQQESEGKNNEETNNEEKNYEESSQAEPKTEEKGSNEYDDKEKEKEREKTEETPAEHEVNINNREEPPPDVEPPKLKENEFEENGAAQSEIQIENKEITNNWETQASESKEEKEKVEEIKEKIEEKTEEASTSDESTTGTPYSQREWNICDFEGATDYIPCLDNKEVIKNLPSTKHYEHRERHCPTSAPTCLVPLPQDYRSPIKWPQSRNEVFCPVFIPIF